MKNLKLIYIIPLLLFTLIFIFGGCKDETVSTTSGGNPTVNYVTLLTPVNDSIIVKVTGGTISFTWSATGTPNHYLIQTHLGSDTTFGTSGIVSDTNSLTLNQNGFLSGQHLWRTWAVYGSDSVVSSTRRFFVQ
jgi:hypothetical protein